MTIDDIVSLTMRHYDDAISDEGVQYRHHGLHRDHHNIVSTSGTESSFVTMASIVTAA